MEENSVQIHCLHPLILSTFLCFTHITFLSSPWPSTFLLSRSLFFFCLICCFSCSSFKDVCTTLLVNWNILLQHVRLAAPCFHSEGGSALEQVAQWSCGCPIPGGIQGQAGCGSGQPGLVVGNPVHSRAVETRWSLWSFSTQAILWFYDDSMKMNMRIPT